MLFVKPGLEVRLVPVQLGSPPVLIQTDLGVSTQGGVSQAILKLEKNMAGKGAGAEPCSPQLKVLGVLACSPTGLILRSECRKGRV